MVTMKKRILFSVLCSLCSVAAYAAAREGSPIYYQSNTTNDVNASAYQNRGYANYVGQSGTKQVVGQRSQTYGIPRPIVPVTSGTMTVNGIATPVFQEPATTLWADYSRRMANFEFKTGVNSILKWDDMIFNEIGVGGEHTFTVGEFDLSAFAEYRMGFLESGGMGIDYDLEAYNSYQPQVGIFTISVGDVSGDTSHLRFGLGAKHIWDIGGWKVTPSIGYEIFKHNLEMGNHRYPNQGIYLPLMTMDGNYVFVAQDSNGVDHYFSVPVGDEDKYTAAEGWAQVCMSPEDILLVQSVGAGELSDLPMGMYDPANGTVPWGVGGGECVVIGGDGEIMIPGTTHIYNTTWSGIFVGLELEKQMTLADNLRFYVQFGLPSYSSEGIWPNRTDWQQNPSFIDEGNNGAYSYRAEIEYNYRFNDRLQLSLKADTDYFHVGNVGGELYLAERSYWVCNNPSDPSGVCTADELEIETSPAHTEKVGNSLKSAVWQSFGLHLGIKYAF